MDEMVTWRFVLDHGPKLRVLGEFECADEHDAMAALAESLGFLDFNEFVDFAVPADYADRPEVGAEDLGRRDIVVVVNHDTPDEA